MFMSWNCHGICNQTFTPIWHSLNLPWQTSHVCMYPSTTCPLKSVGVSPWGLPLEGRKTSWSRYVMWFAAPISIGKFFPLVFKFCSSKKQGSPPPHWISPIGCPYTKMVSPPCFQAASFLKSSRWANWLGWSPTSAHHVRTREGCGWVFIQANQLANLFIFTEGHPGALLLTFSYFQLQNHKKNKDRECFSR